MAVLRVSTGEVYANYSDINKLIMPLGMEVGRFSYPEHLEARVASIAKPLTQEGVDFMFGELSSSVEEMVNNGDFNYAYRRAAVYIPPKEQGGTSSFSMAGDDQPGVSSAEMTASDLGNYMAPHILRANNWHFSFAGAFIKGIQMEDKRQAMIYVTAGEWQRLDPEILTWVVFPHGGPVIGLSFFDRKPDDNGAFETDVIPDNTILETMKF